MSEFSMRNEDSIRQSVEAWPPDRVRQAELLQSQYEADASPIDGLVAMPVDVMTETPRTLEHALGVYAANSPSSSTWQIMPFFNGVETAGARKRADEMTKIARDFSSGELPVHPLTWDYGEDEGVTMGRIRSDPTDQALVHPGKPWLVAGHDVDIRNIHPDYFDAVTEAARNNPQDLFFTTKLEWEVVGSHLPARVMRYWCWLREVVHVSPLPTDANAVVRVDSFYSIGGFNWDVDVTQGSETMDVYRRSIRRFGRQVLHVVEGVPLTTSSRRTYAAVAAGHPPYEMTVAGQFGVHEDKVGVRSGAFHLEEVELDPENLAEILDAMDERYKEKLELHNVTREMRTAVREQLGLPGLR